MAASLNALEQVLPAAAQAPVADPGAIYEGQVRHRRHAPHARQFSYRLFMPLLDVERIDEVLARHPAWSRSRLAPAQFRRSDYHGPGQLPLAAAVRNTVDRELGRRPQGPIRMLAHLRYFGHCFNPVSFYFCYDQSGVELEAILAEITNTPWNERHAYVLDCSAASVRGSAREWSFDKVFHVSPFLPMQRRYRWRFQEPGDALRIHMEVLDGERIDFDVTLALQRRDADRAGLGRCLLRYPLMTVRVVAAIYWQALLTWCRRNPFYPHPNSRGPSAP